jgi:hypothetical protein
MQTIIENEVTELTFPELNADPSAYRNQLIRVTGALTPVESPQCPQQRSHYTGPVIQWALVNENLQMDARGFERVIPLIRPGTVMIVEGVWKLYQGPLGCGKEPERGTAWFLETLRIVEPATFALLATPAGGVPLPTTAAPAGTPDPLSTPDSAVTITPLEPSVGTATMTPTFNATTGVRPPTATGTALATPTSPPTAAGTPAPLPTGQATTPATPGGAATPTPAAGTPTLTYTPEPPGGATHTPGGYPPPDLTATPSDPYP